MLASFPALSLFQTQLGWFGLLGTETGLKKITFGHPSRKAAREAMSTTEVVERDWNPSLRKQCEAFAAGKKVKFPKVPLDRERPLTEFQQRVVDIVRAIPPGETLTYGQVAELAGSPGAARAVGSVMSKNPVPIVIPCHRVVGSSGCLGGFSAPGGVETKRKLLEAEQLAS
jgi:methylated-DNA-[protein]-cysteine S-methyltransferase